jgi:hypothetical protein
VTILATTSPSSLRPAVATDSGVLPAVAGVATCLLPFLSPAGPGNTAPADVAICAAIAVALLWASRSQVPLAFPYLLGVSGMILGGALAANLAGAPASTLLVLVQDLLLFLWGVTLALGSRDSRILRSVTTAWCRTAAIYACVAVASYLAGFSAFSGVNARDGARAAYTFGDPNLAGNYLVTSLFVIAACRRPRSAPLRHVAYVMILVAIAFTGSNGAMVTLLIGTVVVAAVARYRARGVLAGLLTLLATTCLATLGATYVATQVDVGHLREQAAGSLPLLRDSLGRSGGSESQRAVIVGEGYQLFLQGDATGYGPGRTKATLAETQAPYVKEAHNDYLAALLERGVIGEIGLLLLGGAILLRCGRLLVGTLPEEYSAFVPRAWLLVAIAPVMAVAATFYEVEHFRHLWTWLGLIAALALVVQRPGQTPEAPEGSAP